MSESSNVQPLPEDAASAPVQEAAERTPHPVAEQKLSSGLAIASLVCGILGILTGIFYLRCCSRLGRYCAGHCCAGSGASRRCFR